MVFSIFRMTTLLKIETSGRPAVSVVVTFCQCQKDQGRSYRRRRYFQVKDFVIIIISLIVFVRRTYVN